MPKTQTHSSNALLLLLLLLFTYIHIWMYLTFNKHSESGIICCRTATFIKFANIILGHCSMCTIWLNKRINKFYETHSHKYNFWIYGQQMKTLKIAHEVTMDGCLVGWLARIATQRVNGRKRWKLKHCNCMSNAYEVRSTWCFSINTHFQAFHQTTSISQSGS